jgi:hypothetical protein
MDDYGKLFFSPQTFPQHVLQFYVSVLYYSLVNSNDSTVRELVPAIPINKITNPSPAAVIPLRLLDLQSTSCTFNYIVFCISFCISLKIFSDQKRNARSEFSLPHSLLLTNHDSRESLCVKCGHALPSNSKQPSHPACNNRSQLCHFSAPVSQFTAYRNFDGCLPCPRCEKGFVRPSELVVCILVDFSPGITLISVAATL